MNGGENITHVLQRDQTVIGRCVGLRKPRMQHRFRWEKRRRVAAMLQPGGLGGGMQRAGTRDLGWESPEVGDVVGGGVGPVPMGAGCGEDFADVDVAGQGDDGGVVLCGKV